MVRVLYFVSLLLCFNISYGIEFEECQKRVINCTESGEEIKGVDFSIIDKLNKEKKKFQLIDVRPSDMFNNCHLKNSTNLTFPSSNIEKSMLVDLISKKIIPIIICSTCNRSFQLLNKAICEWGIRPTDIIWINEGVNFLKQKKSSYLIGPFCS